MNKKFLLPLLGLLCSLAMPATGQRLYQGQHSVSLSGGLVDNLYFKKQDNAGYFGRLEYSSVRRNQCSWVFGVQASVKYYAYLNDLAGVYQYIGDIGYQIPFLYNYRRNYAISFQLGGNGGYEAVDASNREFANGATVDAKDRFIYGAYLGFNGRVYLSNRVALFADFKERWLTNSDIVNFHSNFGLGIQLMLKN